MSITAKYRFHNCTLEAYRATLSWLRDQPEAANYDSLGYSEVKGKLEEATLLSAAAQFHTYFPTHFFKTAHTLRQAITWPRLAGWLRHNPRLCVVDIGCGAGAGSAALVETLLRLQEEKQIESSVQICCIGVDPNENALALYATFLSNLRRSIENRPSSPHLDISLDYEPRGIPDVTGWVIDSLQEKRASWDLPNLAHVIVMQVNVVSPLERDYVNQRSKYTRLARLGIQMGKTTRNQGKFGCEQAYACKLILESVGIDQMHVITIGTDGYGQRVREVEETLQSIFSSNSHEVQTIDEEEEYSAEFYNPPLGRFSDRETYPTTFYASVISVTSRELQDDTDWREVVSLDNLRLAWVRTRYELLRESFTDEVEIRLFENDLDENLRRMQAQLEAYAEEVARANDYVAYEVPKSTDSVRPRGLSPIEEEILAVAILQKLGRKVLRECSYAYRIQSRESGRDTEYLYEYWWQAYKEFLSSACKAAEELAGGAVLRVDIRSFYTRIEQDRLIRLTSTNLAPRSKRIEWLIRLLLSKDLDDHEVGQGIVQGNIGSGFYANIYLGAIDGLFGVNNEWGVKYFRYVDDMILVVPEPNDGRSLCDVVNEIEQALEDALRDRNLELNEDKTKTYDEPEEFIHDIQSDPALDQIERQLNALTNRLWILDPDCRSLFIDCADRDELWWHRVKLYCKCLNQAGYYVKPSLVSRWIHRYLFNDSRRRIDLQGNSELVIERLPLEDDTAVRQWVVDFELRNAEWLEEKHELNQRLIDMFLDAWNALRAPVALAPGERRKTETRLRFVLSRLCSLGFGRALESVIEVLVDSPWVTKEPARVLEGVARQSCHRELLSIFPEYLALEHDIATYLRAVTLRAMRFLPEVYGEHWDIIVEFSMHGEELIEQLMATETWLFLNDTPGFIEQAQHIGMIREELAKDPPHRLTRNYLLILKQYDSLEMLGDELSLPIAQYVGKVSSRQGASGLFDYVEPHNVRKFYGGRQAEESEKQYIS
jgi:hypothetical protein